MCLIGKSFIYLYYSKVTVFGEIKLTDHIKEIPAKYLHFSLKTFYSLNECSIFSFCFKIKMINLYLQIFYLKYETFLNCMLFIYPSNILISSDFIKMFAHYIHTHIDVCVIK